MKPDTKKTQFKKSQSKAPQGKAHELVKSALHPRNKHRARYDFDALTLAHPALLPFVQTNAYGDVSIDFANPQAVKVLNQALLKHCYNIAHWDIPAQYLCPPIPGRADYVHYLADLLAQDNNGAIPQGDAVRVLDIGVGANMVYPLIGAREYGWQFVGADIDAQALANASGMVESNNLGALVELRLQTLPKQFFKGVIKQGEKFALTMCNPPFHASLAEAQAGSERKWRGLGKAPANNRAKTGAQAAVLNFGGQSNELVCEGGEETFLVGMIKESQQFAMQCGWFTALVSKADSLPYLQRTLKKINAREVRVIEMAQGQKKSRLIAWRWL